MNTTPLIHSRVLQNAVILFAIFGVIAWIVPNKQLMELLHSVRSAIALAVVIAYTPICLEAVRVERLDRVHQLSLGIWLAWFATFCMGIWSLIWRLSGRPPAMSDSDINALFLTMSTLAATLHITAPGAIDGIVPRKNWIALGLAFACGMFFASLILVFNPSIAGVLDGFRPGFSTD